MAITRDIFHDLGSHLKESIVEGAESKLKASLSEIESGISEHLFQAAYDGLRRVQNRVLKTVYDGQIPVPGDNRPDASGERSDASNFRTSLEGGGDFRQAVVIDGRKREYSIYVPKGYDPMKPHSVIVALHGRGQNGKDMENLSGLSRKADEDGNTIVIYPDATQWFGSRKLAAWDTDNGLIPPGADSNDVQFIKRIIDKTKEELNVDRDRVHLVGYSNGGMLAYLAATELKDDVASIAVVAGSMSGEERKPDRPISVLSIHGSDDLLVPVEGLEAPCQISDFILPTLQSQDAVEDFWRSTGSEFVKVRIEGGSHDWPGADRTKSNQSDPDSDYSATEAIWQFFKTHPRASDALSA